MIKDIIKQHNITTHKELDRYLAELSGCKYYWSYAIGMEEGMERAGIFDKCVLITLEGITRYYEDEII